MEVQSVDVERVVAAARVAYRSRLRKSIVPSGNRPALDVSYQTVQITLPPAGTWMFCAG